MCVSVLSTHSQSSILVIFFSAIKAHIPSRPLKIYNYDLLAKSLYDFC